MTAEYPWSFRATDFVKAEEGPGLRRANIVIWLHTDQSKADGTFRGIGLMTAPDLVVLFMSIIWSMLPIAVD